MSDTPRFAVPDRNPSFTKGIFSGDIREDLVFPFPEPSATEPSRACGTRSSTPDSASSFGRRARPPDQRGSARSPRGS